MVSRHCNWRTVEEWNKINVPLSTPSNVASKMYDATLTQLTAHYHDPAIGGVETTITAMREADPDFVLGQSLTLNLQLFGMKSTLDTDPDLRRDLDRLQKQVQCQGHLSSAEKKHAQATQLFAEGDVRGACETWESVLVDHPHDLQALKMCALGWFYLGLRPQLRDSVARVLPHWTPDIPLYGYLHGMYAFGLVECSMYEQAEKHAFQSLAINPYDGWATHALSHVYEMTGQQSQGVDFLNSTVHYWDVCGPISCHNWWHLALHYIELGNFEAAMDVLEKQVKSRCVKQGEMFNLVDTASLLYRLEMQGVKTDGLWEGLGAVCEPYLYKHRSVFNDISAVMTCLGLGDTPTLQSMLTSVENFVREGKGDAHDAHSRVGLPVCRAVRAYKKGDFGTAVDILYPLRYDIPSMGGGSIAQLDVLQQVLIESALQSSDKHHHKLARVMLTERKALKNNSPLTDRLIERVKALGV